MENATSNAEGETVPAHVDRTELRICHLYKRPRIWLQDESTVKVLLNVREEQNRIVSPANQGPALRLSADQSDTMPARLVSE